MEKELQVAIEAAKLAAKAIKDIQDSDSWTTQQKEDGEGPLTEADLAANEILINHISAHFPTDAILSEETADSPSRLSNPRCWIIDPLDGTREFTLGIPVTSSIFPVTLLTPGRLSHFLLHHALELVLVLLTTFSISPASLVLP